MHSQRVGYDWAICSFTMELKRKTFIISQFWEFKLKILAEPCSLKALREAAFWPLPGFWGCWKASASRRITATSFLLHFTISRRWNKAAPSTLCLEITSAKWSGSSLTSSTFHPTEEQAVSPGNSEPRVWLTSVLKHPVVSHSSQERW